MTANHHLPLHTRRASSLFVALVVFIVSDLFGSGSLPTSTAFLVPKSTHETMFKGSNFPRTAVSLSWRDLCRQHGAIPSSSSTSLSSMGLFKDIFRSLSVDGGSFHPLQIDHDALPFPCPEIADMARQQHPRSGETFVTSPSKPHLYLGTFAGGCFWGLELAFQRVEGVEHTAVGYTQGKEPEPNYEQLCAGATGHTEAVMVYFNPEVVGYEHLVRVFLDRIDPTTVDGQGRDYGRQYRTGIYTHSKEQEEIARKLLTEASPKYTRPIATELRPAMPFWPAEAYHQHYLEKGGRFGTPQSAEKGCRDEIRCYG